MQTRRRRKDLRKGDPLPGRRINRVQTTTGLDHLIHAVVIATIVLTPLAMWRELFSQFTVPKFILLTVGSSIIVGLLSFYAFSRPGDLTILRSPFCLLLSCYVAALAISTIASLSPGISFFGSISRRMGFITYLSFAVCFYGVVVGIGRDRTQLIRLLWAIIVSGFVAASYGMAQVIGLAPLAAQRLSSSADNTFRIDSTLGHPNYAGNLLLFFVFTAIGLAFAVRNKGLKVFAVVTSCLSLAAIAYTGTRGAWVGLLAGLIVSIFMLIREKGVVPGTISLRRVYLVVGGVSVCLLLLGAFVWWADGAAPIRARIGAFWSEGFTGAGRTVLWKLSIAMVSKYWITGTGLEMFRVAFLPYKTPDYPEVSGGINPEDPHSAYLSSLLSTGVLPTLIYFSLIVLALRFFYLSIRNAPQKTDKFVGIGLLASFVAVLTHNVFIFYLIPTGLYFFVFLALSYCWYKITREEPTTTSRQGTSKAKVLGKPKGNPRFVAALCSIPVVITIAYAYRLFTADQSVLYSRAMADACNYSQSLAYGERATSVRVGQSDYHCYFAMALERLANKCGGANRGQLLERAIAEMERSLESTLLTEVRLAYLAELNLAAGSLDRAEELLAEAERLDPYAASTHLIRTRLFIAKGDHANARAELKRARRPWVPLATLQGLAREVRKIRATAPRNTDRRPDAGSSRQ